MEEASGGGVCIARNTAGPLQSKRRLGNESVWGGPGLQQVFSAFEPKIASAGWVE